MRSARKSLAWLAERGVYPHIDAGTATREEVAWLDETVRQVEFADRWSRWRPALMALGIAVTGWLLVRRG